jgi:hypothetical protein
MSFSFEMTLDSKLCTDKIRGGVDKSLARPGRKQATATILGIYSTKPSTLLSSLL